MSSERSVPQPPRDFLVKGMALVEDAVYGGLGILLATAAIALLVQALVAFVKALVAREVGGQIVTFLDQILLVLLIIELLYTVQVSFREHGLVAEPFLVVALIAVIRRVLVLTAELPSLPQASPVAFNHALMELGLLTAMIVVLVGSLIALQRHARTRSPAL